MTYSFFKNKLGEKIGVVLLSVIFGGISGFLTASYQANHNIQLAVWHTQLESVSRFNDDLDQVSKNLYLEIPLSDCLRSHSFSSFRELYTYCRQQTTRQDENTVDLFVGTYLRLAKALGSESLEHLFPTVKAIEYDLYEIENNVFALELWKHEGCTNMVNVIEIDDIKEIPDLDGVCDLAVESRDHYKKSLLENCDGACSESVIPPDAIELVIVPGNEQTVDQYFQSANQNLRETVEANFLVLSNGLAEILHTNQPSTMWSVISDRLK